MPKSPSSDLIRGWTHARVKPGCKLFGETSCSTSWNRSCSCVLVDSTKTHRDLAPREPRHSPPPRRSKLRGVRVLPVAARRRSRDPAGGGRPRREHRHRRLAVDGLRAALRPDPADPRTGRRHGRQDALHDRLPRGPDGRLPGWCRGAHLRRRARRPRPVRHRRRRRLPDRHGRDRRPGGDHGAAGGHRTAARGGDDRQSPRRLPVGSGRRRRRLARRLRRYGPVRPARDRRRRCRIPRHRPRAAGTARPCRHPGELSDRLRQSAGENLLRGRVPRRRVRLRAVPVCRRAAAARPARRAPRSRAS